MFSRYFNSANILLAQGTLGEGLEYEFDHTWPLPNWVTVLLMIFAVAFVTMAYLRERGGSRLAARLSLAGIRLTLVVLVVLMMYGLVLNRHRTDLPDLIIVLDDSASMALVDQYDDSKLLARLANRVEAVELKEPTRINLAKSVLLTKNGSLLDKLKKKYNLKFYLLGSTARIQASDDSSLPRHIRDVVAGQSASHLGKGIRDILKTQQGRPTAAIVVLSDGITTSGTSLAESAAYARRKGVPLFTVGLGNDKPPRDIRLSDLLVEQVAFVGDTVHFDFKLTGSGFEEQEVTVRLKQSSEGPVLEEKKVSIGSDGASQSVRITHRPPEEGDFQFVVEVEPQQGEANAKNNLQSRLVRVRDETIRVLLVQAYPSYEFRYLKNLLGRQTKSGASKKEKSIELTTVLQEADENWSSLEGTARRVFPVRRDELSKYDVIIFGDVDSSRLGQVEMNNIVDFVTEDGGGMIVISGPRYTPLAYRNTPLAGLMPVDLSSASVPPPGAMLNESFPVQPTELGLASPQMQLGDTLTETIDIWQKFPGMYWMLEAPDLKPGVRVLAEHPTRTGNDGRNLPLICMQYVGRGKIIFHAIDETRRWQFRAGDKYFGRYWIQTLRYLSRAKLLGQKGDVAELTSDRQEYRLGETARLRLRFFDDRWAPPQDDGVTIVLERKDGNRKTIKLHRDTTSRGIFEGTVSSLAKGEYQAWVATPTLKGDLPTQSFSVVSPPGELARLVMDSAQLEQAAQVSQGRYYTLQNVHRLQRELPRGRQVQTAALPPFSIWTWWPLKVAFALVFIGLLVTEWLLRKRVGML